MTDHHSVPLTQVVKEFNLNVVFAATDYEKIRLVLGDNRKADESEQFVVAKSDDYMDLFGGTDIGLDEGNSYEINEKAFGNIEAYRSI